MGTYTNFMFGGCMIREFYAILRDTIAKYDPKCKPSTKKFPVKYTRNSFISLRKKNKLRMKYRKYKNPLDELALLTLNKRCAELIDTCHKNYVADLEGALSDNPKLFWTFIKNKTRNSNAYPSSMTFGDDKADSGDVGNELRQDREMIRRATQHVAIRVTTCLQHRGGHFEQFL
ncbi:unnamed protein product [Parnassius mnemosyne]|uniref:Uncharacterized protein n=1 Tax=Parnassius mnemosyne TaxID=213953 RepID=A0AAV1LCG2_9NEOP